MRGQHHLHDKWWPPEAEAETSASGDHGADRSAEDDAATVADEWTTGGEPMTDPQASYLDELADDVGVSVPDSLSKAEASDLIDDLQQVAERDLDDEER